MVKHHCWRILGAFTLMWTWKSMYWEELWPQIWSLGWRAKAIIFTLYPKRSPKSPKNLVPELNSLLSKHLKSNSMGEILWLQQQHGDRNPFYPTALCKRQWASPGICRFKALDLLYLVIYLFSISHWLCTDWRTTCGFKIGTPFLIQYSGLKTDGNRSN